MPSATHHNLSPANPNQGHHSREEETAQLAGIHAATAEYHLFDPTVEAEAILADTNKDLARPANYAGRHRPQGNVYGRHSSWSDGPTSTHPTVGQSILDTYEQQVGPRLTPEEVNPRNRSFGNVALRDQATMPAWARAGRTLLSTIRRRK